MVLWFKCGLAFIGHKLGWLSRMRRRASHRCLILCYHRVFRDTRAMADYYFPGMVISEAMFEKQMECLAANYRVLPLRELVDGLKQGRPQPRDAVVITFDDGYLDNYLYAYPILQKYRLPAAFFLVSDFIGGASLLWFDKVAYILHRAGASPVVAEIFQAHLPPDLALRLWTTLAARARPLRERIRAVVGLLKEAPGSAVARVVDALEQSFPDALEAGAARERAMTWDMVREVQRNGIEVGSHSRTHPILTRLSADQLTGELYGSKRQLEQHLDAPVPWFCYPNGDYNAAIQQRLVNFGFRAACSLRPGVNESANDLMALRRININEAFAKGISGTFSESLFMAELAGLFDGLLLRRFRNGYEG